MIKSNGRPEECQTAINLTEYWRRDNNGSYLKPDGAYHCDLQDMINDYAERPWFRFTGYAGKMMLHSCPPYYSCGTRGGLWSNEAMPSEIGEVMATNAFGSWGGTCKNLWVPILVMRCSDDFLYDFIYKLNVSSVSCPYSFCGM